MLKRRSVFIIIGIIVLAVVGLGGFFLYKNSQKQISPVAQIQPPTPTTEALSTWNDQSQFTFQYPKSLTLNPHDEDQVNYAHVELTSIKNHPGNLIVWAKDTTASDIARWIKQNKITGSIDTILGGLPAEKHVITEESIIQVTSVIKDGYLYQIEANITDTDFWDPILKTVTSSFAFTKVTPEQQESAPDTDSGGQDTGGDEEVVE